MAILSFPEANCCDESEEYCFESWPCGLLYCRLLN